MSELLARLPGTSFADGSVCDVELWLGTEPAPDPDVFAAMVLLRDGEGRCAATWSPRRQEWSIPGGWREPDESVTGCAVREVLEETGVRLDPAGLTPVGMEVFSPGGRPGRWPAEGGAMQLFTASLDSPGPPLVAAEPDAVDPQWLTVQEFESRAGQRFWWPLVAALVRP